MHRIARVTVVTTFLLVGMLGCSRTVVLEGPAPGVRVREPLAPGAGVRLNTVNIIDKSLQDWQGPNEGRKRGKIAVESTNSRRTETDTLEVWASLRNRTDHPLQIEGRTQFFDAKQAPIEGPTAWQRVFLPPQGVATYKELSAKTGEIAYYYIEIREGR